MNQKNQTEEVVSYKCPGCGSDLIFDANAAKLVCSSCGSQHFVSEFEEFEEENAPEIKKKTTVTKFNEDEVKEYNCQNCGASLVTDAHTSSTNCNFCGSPMVIADRLTGDVAPAQVIPFKFNAEDAQKAFKKWCKNGLVTPKDFMSEERIRNIEGIYIPFWLYDLNGNAQGEALCTRVRHYNTSSHSVTETKNYIVYRNVVADYIKVPIDASIKMDDELMDLLEPFDFKELNKFNSAYLSGYSSEKYNYTDEELFPRVQTKTHEFINEFMRSTIKGYSSVVLRNTRANIQQKDAVYTMLPIYVVNYKYKDKEYTFAMNGQTGKVVGKPPICIPKVIKWCLLTFFIIQAIAQVIFWTMEVLL